MTIEIKMLMFSVVLGIGQLFVSATASTLQRGLKWNLTARDEKMPDLTGVHGRLDRAFYNFLESFAFFAAAVLMVVEMKAANATSALGAEIYFFARLIYVPVYASGISVLRTLVWVSSLAGIFMVLSALL